MREMIQNWLTIGTTNPQDDNRFYEIVVKAFPQKIEFEDFDDAVKTVTGSYGVDELYHRYEDLHNFMNYLKQNGVIQ